MKNKIIGPFIKSKNNSSKIIYNLLLSTVPFIAYRLYITKMEDIFILLCSIIFTLLTSIILEIIKNIKNYKFNFKNHRYHILMSIVTYLFIPYNTPIILVAISCIISTIINKFIKNINPTLISGLIINLYFIIIKDKALHLNMNIFILTLISVAVLTFLIKNKSIKFRICIPFILITILSIFIKEFKISEIYLIIILGIYILPELYSSPTIAYTGYIYSILVAILYILLPLEYIIILLLISNIFIKYLDLLTAYLLAKS